MVSNLQDYPRVTITNKTPYAAELSDGIIRGHSCDPDYIKGIASGGTWTTSSRNRCMVFVVETSLHGVTVCESYINTSGGTRDTQFSILMKGDDACCVLSSHESPQKCP